MKQHLKTVVLGALGMLLMLVLHHLWVDHLIFHEALKPRPVVAAPAEAK